MLSLKETLAFVVEQVLLFWPPYRVEDDAGEHGNG